MVLFRITENEPSKMHNVRPYVYSSPCIFQESIIFVVGKIDIFNLSMSIIILRSEVARNCSSDNRWKGIIVGRG